MSSALGINRPTFYINSNTRLSGDDSSSFTHVVNIGDLNNYDSVCLVSAIIPKTYYNINDDNNKFYISEGGIIFTITLDKGDYTIENLPVILSALLTAKSHDIGHSLTYTVSYPIITELQTHKLKFHVVNPNEYAIILDINNVGITEINKVLGFLTGVGYYYFNTNAGISTLYSTNAINLNYTQYITLKSNISFNEGTSNTNNDILQIIPVSSTTSFRDNILYTLINMDDSIKRLSNNRSKIFSFGIYDDQDRLLDLNGSDISFTMCLFQHNNHNELYVQELKEQKRLKEEMEQKDEK